VRVRLELARVEHLSVVPLKGWLWPDQQILDWEKNPAVNKLVVRVSTKMLKKPGKKSSQKILRWTKISIPNAEDSMGRLQALSP
jgi:hypothetical protein